MAERMVECIGWKDPIGGGLYNMGVTDERIIRCRDCEFYSPEREVLNEVDPDGQRHVIVEPGACCNPKRCCMSYSLAAGEMVVVGIESEPDGFCKWSLPRSRGK